ncbi:MAG: flagellin [Rhizomicrobium sp.]|jgi:flagellar hook-associated protein 3 FlgL
MTVERVATNSQAQYLLSQITKANAALDVTQAQVASGMVSTDYAGIGDKTASLEAARSAAARADAYSTNTQLAVTQTDLQDTQLTTLSSLAEQLKEAISTAAGNGDGTGLMTTAQDIFQQASSILNSTDSNGNYIYAGEQGNTKPFTATSLSDLTTGTVSSFFQNGTQKASVLVGDGQSVQIGVLASDVGTQLMTALQNLQNADSPSGSLDASLTSTQISDLTDNVLPSAATAYTDLNTATAANGETYTRLQDDVTTQQSMSTLYKGFVSDIEDVDMTTAATNLSQNQVALQAALEVTAKLGQLSLLNYLPTTTSTG